MKGCLRVVRGTEVKFALPGPSIEINANGTLWMSGNPILGIEDPAEKKRIAALARARKFTEIPDIYFTRLGDNPNGLWAGTDEEWAKHPGKAEQDRQAAEKAAEQAKQVRIYLSSRGWGDYSACEWIGDITRPDSEILAECQARLKSAADVDKRNQSDDDLLSKIAKARADWETAPARKATKEAAEEEDIRRKIATGYCFACESYCHGDCGKYSKDPMVKFNRDLKQAVNEQNYGINE